MTGARAAEPTGDLGGEPPRRQSRPPAPPPPPPRRDSAVFPPLGGALDGLDLGPPEPSDVDLDEEALATAPPRPSQQVPLPPPPSFRPSEPEPDSEPDIAGISTDAVTSSRDRGVMSSAGASVLSTPGDPSGWLRQVLDDDGITAVYVMGAQSVELERNGRREPVALGAAEASALASTLKAFAGRAGLSLDSGVVDAILPTGVRFSAVLPPLASDACATFLKRPRAGRSLAELVSEGALSREMREILEAAVTARRNIVVAGDPTATQAVLEGLANAIPARLRVVAYGALIGAPNAGYTWTTLSPEQRNPELLRAAAALRADYLVLDLAAAPSAADVLRECAHGQQGALVSVAGRSAADALVRLEAFANAANGPSAAIRALVESTFDVVVHAIALADGRPLVLDVAEPRVDADGRLRAQSLALFHVDGASDGKPTGRFQVTGAGSRLAETLAARGAVVSASTLRR